MSLDVAWSTRYLSTGSAPKCRNFIHSRIGLQISKGCDEGRAIRNRYLESGPSSPHIMRCEIVSKPYVGSALHELIKWAGGQSYQPMTAGELGKTP